MLCEKCGENLREGAKFCPECGLTAGGAGFAPSEKYIYETLQQLFPLSAKIATFIIWLAFTGIGVLAALGSGFWYVGVIFSGIITFSILVVLWANKGKGGKWFYDCTMWVITPEGYGTGYPSDFAKPIVVQWINFISAEYRPDKCEIALRQPNGSVGLIKTNPDNHAYVEQLVRLYMSQRSGQTEAGRDFNGNQYGG